MAKYSYSNNPSWGPRAPVVPIDIGPPWSKSPAKTEIEALIDSGAAMSTINCKMAEEIGLRRGRRQPADTAGGRITPYVYSATFYIEGRPYPGPVLGLNLDFPIVGRDILNQLVTELDGPGLTLTITDPKADI